MVKIMLFVSPHCTHCPIAAAVASRVVKDYDEVAYEKIRIKTKLGKRLAAITL